MSNKSNETLYSTKPKDLKPGDKLGSVVVAVIGHAYWAAYQIELPELDGYPTALSVPDPQKVASNGEKINRQAAEKLFPVCVKAGLQWRD